MVDLTLILYRRITSRGVPVLGIVQSSNPREQWWRCEKSSRETIFAATSPQDIPEADPNAGASRSLADRVSINVEATEAGLTILAPIIRDPIEGAMPAEARDRLGQLRAQRFKSAPRSAPAASDPMIVGPSGEHADISEGGSLMPFRTSRVYYRRSARSPRRARLPLKRPPLIASIVFTFRLLMRSMATTRRCEEAAGAERDSAARYRSQLA